MTQFNGNLEFISLQEQYEVSGFNIIGVTKAEGILSDLLYYGDNKPTNAFYIINMKDAKYTPKNEYHNPKRKREDCF